MPAAFALDVEQCQIGAFHELDRVMGIVATA
jgi:hypothetical protein